MGPVSATQIISDYKKFRRHDVADHDEADGHGCRADHEVHGRSSGTTCLRRHSSRRRRSRRSSSETTPRDSPPRSPSCVSLLLPCAQTPQGAETFDAAWTIIKNTHFDKTMNGLNWDAVRDELRPRAAAAKTPAELRAVIRDMLGRLGLSHFALIPSGAETDGRPAGRPATRAAIPGSTVRLIGSDLVVTEVNRETAQPLVRPGWR